MLAFPSSLIPISIAIYETILRLNYDSKDAPSIFYPGFGAQINCHMGLNNVWHKLPKYDSINLHRRSDPGVGAFTPWHDIPNVARRRIQAGEGKIYSEGKENIGEE